MRPAAAALVLGACRAPDLLALELSYGGCEIVFPGPVCQIDRRETFTLWTPERAPPAARVNGRPWPASAWRPVDGGGLNTAIPVERSLWVEVARADRAPFTIAVEPVGPREPVVGALVDAWRDPGAVQAILDEAQTAELSDWQRATYGAWAFQLALLHHDDPDEARAVAERFPDPGPNLDLTWARAQNESKLARAVSDRGRALRSARAALQAAQRAGDERRATQAAESLAAQLAALGQWRRAAEVYRAMRPPADGCTPVRTYVNQAWTLLVARDAGAEAADLAALPDPVDLLLAAREATDPCETFAPDRPANVAVNLALAWQQRGDLRRAEQELRRVPPTIGGAIGEWATEVRARVALADGRPADALRLWEAAAGSPEMRWRATWGRARAAEALGDEAGALQTYADAARMLHENADLVPLLRGRAGFLQAAAQMTGERVELLVRLGRPADALAVARSARLALLRPLAAAEPRALGPAEVLLLTEDTENGLLVLTARGGTVRAQIGLADLASLGRALAPLLTGAERVSVLPSASIRDLPLHAAPLAGRTLLDAAPVAWIADLSPALPARDPGEVLVVTDPEGNLPGARAEGGPLAEQLGGTWLSAESATAENVVLALERASGFHYAGHAWVDEETGAAELSTWDGERIGVEDVLALDPGPAWVVLSACRSGEEPQTSVTPLGLGEAFLASGARAVVVSLADLREDDAHAFTTALYAAGWPSAPAAAFRRALLSIRATHPEAYRAYRLLTP